MKDVKFLVAQKAQWQWGNPNGDNTMWLKGRKDIRWELTSERDLKRLGWRRWLQTVFQIKQQEQKHESVKSLYFKTRANSFTIMWRDKWKLYWSEFFRLKVTEAQVKLNKAQKDMHWPASLERRDALASVKLDPGTPTLLSKFHLSSLCWLHYHVILVNSWQLQTFIIVTSDHFRRKWTSLSNI